MSVDLAWAKRNLGVDPIATQAPASMFAFAAAAVRCPLVPRTCNEIIDFDSVRRSAESSWLLRRRPDWHGSRRCRGPRGSRPRLAPPLPAAGPSARGTETWTKKRCPLPRAPNVTGLKRAQGPHNQARR